MKRPTIIQRARAAWKVYRRGYPDVYALAAAKRQTKAAPFFWPQYRDGVPQWHIVSYEAYVNEGFNLNSLIYSAIMYKVRAASSAPLRALMGDVDSPERVQLSEPLAQLVARPNNHQSFVEFHSQNIVYINISGNCYILLDRPEEGGVPEAMYSLRPDRVFVVPGVIDGRHTILGYLYVPEGRAAWVRWPEVQRREAIDSGHAVAMSPENMIHVKFPNPMDPLEGMGEGLSPISPLAQSADVDNAVTHFLKLFFDQGSVLPGVLKFDAKLDDEAIATIKENWMDMYGSYENWVDVGVLGSGGEYQRIGLNFEEMSFQGIDERNESRILAPFGVPGVLLGTRLGLNRGIRSNARELRRQFWEDTLIPENRLFEVDFQFYLRDEDQFVAFDYSNVPALQQDIPKLAEAAFRMWSMGTPANQAFQATGLGRLVGDVPGGDVGYISQGLLPSGFTPEEEDITAEGAPEAEDDDRKILDEFGTLYNLARDNEGKLLGEMAAARLLEHISPLKKKTLTHTSND